VQAGLRFGQPKQPIPSADFVDSFGNGSRSKKLNHLFGEGSSGGERQGQPALDQFDDFLPLVW
jgi:hypothetical protein